MVDDEVTFQVPNLTNSDFSGGHIPWTLFHDTVLAVRRGRPIERLNLSSAIHLKPFVLALIAALCRKLQSSNLQVDWPEDEEARNHLARLGFPTILGVDGPTATQRATNVSLEVLKTRPSDGFSYALTELLAAEFSQGLQPGMIPSISNHIDEMILNALTHSESEIGCVVIGQAFPQRCCVEATIVDLGITILGHLGRQHPDLLAGSNTNADEAAIQKAVEEGVTGTRGLNRYEEPNSGAGLHEIKSYIEVRGGELAILSGSAIVCFGDNPCTQPLHGARFPGTLVNLKFSTD